MSAPKSLYPIAPGSQGEGGGVPRDVRHTQRTEARPTFFDDRVRIFVHIPLDEMALMKRM
eukprot:7390275-Prymnesium_polylepis.2